MPALVPLTAAAPTTGVAAAMAAGSAEGGDAGVETAVANVVVAVAVQQAAGVGEDHHGRTSGRAVLALVRTAPRRTMARWRSRLS